jgi:hypothetical protein
VIRSAFERFRDHVRELWPTHPLLPAIPFVLWPAYCLCRGEYRWELLVTAALGGILPYVGPRSKRLYLGILPIGLVGVLYDSMRFVQDVGITPGRVHACDLATFDARFFGTTVNGVRVPVHDAIRAWDSLPLDVFFAIPYGIFLFAAAGFAVFLYVRDYPRMLRFSQTFLVLNVAGFITYHLLPAAPPWYVYLHGCSVDLRTQATEGVALARVDAFFGVPYFHDFYGRSHDVFGAIPSLHVAYPLIIAIEGWSPLGAFRAPLRVALRGFSLFFIAWMFAAAVYLEHHWVIDVIVGLVYGAVGSAILRLFPVPGSPQPGPAREGSPAVAEAPSS